MKKLLLLSTVCMLATQAFAADIKPYVEAKLTHNWMKAEYEETGFGKDFKDNVFGGSIEVGAKLNQFRVGLEGYYNDKLKDDIKVSYISIPVEGKTKGFFLNGYYDFQLPDNLKKVKPYIGAGVGYSWLEESLKNPIFGGKLLSSKDEDIGWNIGLGLGYELNQNFDLTLGYRYENLGKIKDNGSETEFTNHKVSLGLRYTF